MTAYGNIQGHIEGASYGGEFEAISRVAGATINPGMPVVAYEGDEEVAYQYLLDKSVLTYSTDFITGNSAIVTVNGLSTTATVFASTHDVMMAAIAAKVTALTGVDATAATTVLTIVSKGAPITVSTAVTLGSTQPTSSQVLSCSAGILGVALRTYKQGVTYLQYDAVPVLREGEIWVLTNDAVVANKAAYMVAATGKFTDESAGNVSTNYVFRSSTNGAALARLELIK